MGMTGRTRAFYFLRHGQSEANAGGYPAGKLDSPLTAQGRAEAEAVRTKIEALAPAPLRIVTSGLVRARDTAAIVNRQLQLPIAHDPRLNEQDYGDFQGQDKDPLIAQHGAHWFANPPNGESFTDFRARIRAAVHVIVDADERPLLVGHGGMVVALGIRDGAALDSVTRVGNCTLLRVSADADGAGFSFLNL